MFALVKSIDEARFMIAVVSHKSHKPNRQKEGSGRAGHAEHPFYLMVSALWLATGQVAGR